MFSKHPSRWPAHIKILLQCTGITNDQRCVGGVAGECKSNSKYMAGDGYTLGACRRACQLCTVCAHGRGGAACRAANRAQAGYLPQLGEDQD